MAASGGAGRDDEAAGGYAIVPVGEVQDVGGGAAGAAARARRQKKAPVTADEKAEEILRLGSEIDGVAERAAKLLDAAGEPDAGAVGGPDEAAKEWRTVNAELSKLSIALDAIDVAGMEVVREMRREQLQRIATTEALMVSARDRIPSVAAAAEEDEDRARVREAAATSAAGPVAYEEDIPGVDEEKDEDMGAGAAAASAGVDEALVGVQEFLTTVEDGLASLRSSAGEGSVLGGAARDQCETYGELVAAALVGVDDAERAGADPASALAMREKATALQTEVASLLSGAPSAAAVASAGLGAELGGGAGGELVGDPVRQMTVSQLKALLDDAEIPYDGIVERADLEERARIVLPPEA